MIFRFNGKTVNGIKDLMRLLTKLRTFSLVGLCRLFWLKLRGKEILVIGSCHGCGKCCNSISLEGSEGWLRSEKSFQRVIEKYPEYGRFTVIGRDAQGYLLFRCTLCTTEGTCSAYEERLPLCRRYPESSLVFAGGRLLPDCGYNFAEVVPFAKVLGRELKKAK